MLVMYGPGNNFLHSSVYNTRSISNTVALPRLLMLKHGSPQLAHAPSKLSTKLLQVLAHSFALQDETQAANSVQQG
jgi:hypothetical protein